MMDARLPLSVHALWGIEEGVICLTPRIHWNGAINSSPRSLSPAVQFNDDADGMGLSERIWVRQMERVLKNAITLHPFSFLPPFT